MKVHSKEPIYKVPTYKYLILRDCFIKQDMASSVRTCRSNQPTAEYVRG